MIARRCQDDLGERLARCDEAAPKRGGSEPEVASGRARVAVPRSPRRHWGVWPQRYQRIPQSIGQDNVNLPQVSQKERRKVQALDSREVAL